MTGYPRADVLLLESRKRTENVEGGDASTIRGLIAHLSQRLTADPRCYSVVQFPSSTTPIINHSSHSPHVAIMSEDTEAFYDEIEIEDMTFDCTLQLYHYPCPCGDRFEISIGDLRDGEDVAVCPSCSLMIKVVYEVVSRSLCAVG